MPIRITLSTSEKLGPCLDRHRALAHTPPHAWTACWHVSITHALSRIMLQFQTPGDYLLLLLVLLVLLRLHIPMMQWSIAKWMLLNLNGVRKNILLMYLVHCENLEITARFLKNYTSIMLSLLSFLFCPSCFSFYPVHFLQRNQSRIAVQFQQHSSKLDA